VSGRCTTPRSTGEWETSCEARKPAKLGPNTSLSLGEFGHCIQQAAFSSVMAGGRAGGVSHYDEALDICERHLGDQSEPCKLQVCDNLGFADGNLSQTYPEKQTCRQQAVKNSSCTDGKRNGLETGVDCGGPRCPPCSPIGKGTQTSTASAGCRAHTDCSSGFCGLNGVAHRDQCYPPCPDGPISDHEPCGCYQTVTPQGVARLKPVPNTHDTNGAESWEGQYGAGKRVYCCGGQESYLTKGQSCSSAPHSGSQ